MESFLWKSIIKKGIFTLKFRKPDWTEQSKVVLSKCIMNCKNENLVLEQ